MGTIMLTADIAGRITMNREARKVWGALDDSTPSPERWSMAFHCLDPLTRMPLPNYMVPSVRAMQCGKVEGQVILVAPPGRRERLLTVTAQADYNEDGEVIGVVTTGRPTTKREYVGYCMQAERGMDDLTVPCVCEDWCVTFPGITPTEWITEALQEHLDGCVVAQAAKVLSASPW